MRRKKNKNASSPKIINEILQLRENNHRNLRQACQFIVPHAASVLN